MHLPDLAPEHMIVLTFGPGVGELTLVRVPPDVWMVVDGCGVGRIDYAMEALAHYQASPRLVLLTHSHNDHSRGLASVIEAATPRDHQDQWPRIGMVLPPGNDVAARSADYIAGVTLKAIDAITSRWRRLPSCRWDVNVGDVEPLGEATLHVLSPSVEVRANKLELWRTRRPFDRNVISTALLLSWRGRRILLGSDLVEIPDDGWSHSLVLDPELGDHELLKVPHHGSDKALHDDVLRPRGRVAAPLRTITPYNTSRLPGFSAGESAHRVVSHGGTTYLTGLPRSHGLQSGQAEERTLADLATHDTITFDPKTTGFPDCYVLVSIPPDGGAPQIEQGPGSIRVLP